MTPAQKESLRQFVLRAGFHKVGFTDCEVLSAEREYLQQRGPGPFEPTDLPPRTDPRAWLPTARSVVAVALSYQHSEPEKPAGVRGRLSRYCRGLDYHDLMLQRLEDVAKHLQDTYGVESRCFVDTGPPLERAFAEKAGLGRLGKNTNLIAPKLGSWIFLGLLVTELSIPPDLPATYSICGSCTLCLQACPTQCLTEWELDSKDCLGYLNQKSDDIPVEHRVALDDWLFGCDICQTVCPHNVKAQSGLTPEFEPLSEPGAFPDLLKMAKMTEEQFEQWFRPTAADWRGPEAIKRNALVALGNCEIEEAVDALLDVMPTGNPLLDEHGAWAAERLAKRFSHRRAELVRLLA
jgi:epoxyqueuosine reductase